MRNPQPGCGNRKRGLGFIRLFRELGIGKGCAIARGAMKKIHQRAWFQGRPRRLTAVGFFGLALVPGLGLAQQAGPPAQEARPVATLTAEQQVPSVTLEEAVARALKASPQVAQAAGTVTTSEAAERSAFGAYLPSVSASAAGSLASSRRIDPETGAVSSGSSDTYNAGLSVGYDLFTGFQRSANRAQARAQTGAARAQLISQRANAILDVEGFFFEVLRAQGLEEVARSRIERAEQNAEAADRRLAVGSATRSDVLRAKLELTTARDAQLQAQTQRRAAALALGRLIGEDGPVEARARDEDLAPRALALTEEALVDELTVQAPSVVAAEASLRASEAGVKAARSAYLPTLRLSAGYNWFNEDPVPTGGQTSWSVRLGLSYPIFDGFLREERVERARTQASVSQVELSDARRAVRSGVGQALGQLRLATERITLAEQSVQVAQEDLKVQQERYRLGATTILELLTSQENLVTAETNLVAARFDYRIARAELEAIAGRPL